MIPRRERMRQAAVDEIKTIAWELIKEKGTSNITINGITKQMGMTAPAFYSYFKSRDELMQQMVLDAYEMYQTEIESALQSIQEDLLTERLVGLFMAYRKWAIDNSAAFGLFSGRLVFGFEPGRKKIVKKAEELFELFHSVFLDVWKKGLIRLPDNMRALPKSYQSQIDSLIQSLRLEGPANLVHAMISIILLAHGAISMEISGRYNHLIDFSILYENQIIGALEQIGLNPEKE